jgi:hypothetical protein
MKTNKTINLVRGIMMLTRSSINREEKTLINKIEDACYELIDMAHKSEIRVVDRLTYIDDLFVLATQVNLFSQENCEVVRAAIKNILNYYETKPKDNTDHSVNLGVRDLLAYESLFSETNENKSSANLRELSEQNDIKKISLRDSTQVTAYLESYPERKRS